MACLRFFYPLYIISPLICIVAGKMEREGQMLETLQRKKELTVDGNKGRGIREKWRTLSQVDGRKDRNKVWGQDAKLVSNVLGDVGRDRTCR